MAPRFPDARNWLVAILLTATMAAVPVAALAQDPPANPPKQQKKLPEAPGKLPKVGADRTRGLDFLFGALKAAPDENSAKHVEARIWALWLHTPSDTAALLMMRAKAATSDRSIDRSDRANEPRRQTIHCEPERFSLTRTCPHGPTSVGK